MPYIGRSTDGFGVRNRFVYVASSGATSVSGADANGATLTFTDGAFVDVYLNGVLLKPTTDYNTSTANTIAGLSALNTSDEVTVVVYDVFTVADMVSATSGGTFSGAVTFGSTVSGLDVNGTEVILDADADTSITADTDDQIDIKIGGTDEVTLSSSGIVINEGSNDRDFRIESNDSANMFVLDGGNNLVTLQNDSDTDYNTNQTASNTVLTLKNTTSGAANTVGLSFATEANGEQYITAVQNADNDASRLQFGCRNGGSRAETIRITENGFLKTTSNSSIIALDDSIHEINTATDSSMIVISSSNASYGGNGVVAACLRGSSASYNIFAAIHGDGSSDRLADRMFKVDGTGALFSDASTSIGSGADYAEYFEWKDGNSSSEDRIGQSVVLDGNKIRKATSSDSASSIIGVISGNPSVVGDSAEFRWQGKYELDSFNRRIDEDVDVVEWQDENTNQLHSYNKNSVPSHITVPSNAKTITIQNNKVSTDFDSSKKDDYVPRKNRKEWDAVGLMGKLRMLKGQPTGDRWIKMRDISDTVEEWLVR
jgi:hypothetical protein